MYSEVIGGLAVSTAPNSDLSMSLVEEPEETGMWQNFPVKLGGHRHWSFCTHTPPFLHNIGQTTAEKERKKVS